ncbi:uncharacterized protein LOC128223070 [Mya arenaria]|uniref:uncharacterized protein LOC128223070 n=1 Tax=Mya arenaria TaxID=6604 RepID=UPI0022E1CE53|nr:uncharacterized protein LOC128223070 [Mya arenaria]
MDEDKVVGEKSPSKGRRSARKRRRRESYSPELKPSDAEKKKKTDQPYKTLPNRPYDMVNGEPFSCHMCKSPFVVNLKKSGKKGGRSRHMPLPKIRIDKNTNQEMQLCNACVALYDKPLRRRISKPVDVPTEEQQTKYKEGIEEFIAELKNEWSDPRVEKLYCPPSQKKLCGCLQKFIKTSVKSDQKHEVDLLLDLMKEAEKLRQEKCYVMPENQKTRVSVGLGNGQKKSKRFEDFVIIHRQRLREDMRLCERATQRILIYSNNFLHKRLKTDNRPCRIERTRGKAILGKLPDIEAMIDMYCCADSCVMLALTHRRLLQDWRTRAQQGQAEARRVLAEMLTPAGATHFNCNTFITMVTGCSNSTITKVCNHMTLTGGIRDPPEHGLKKYWQEHFKKAGTRSENTETQDAEIAEGSGKRKKTVSEHPSKSQSPPAVSHPPAVPASTGHMVVQGRAQTHTSRESELPSMQVIPNSRNSSLTGQQILNQPVKIPLTNKDVDLNPPMMDHSNFQLFMPPPPKYRENLSYTNKLREMSRNMTFSMTSQPMTPHLVTSHHVTSHQMTSLPVTTLSMTSLAPQANMSNYGLIHPIVQQQIQNNQSQSFVDQHLSHLQQMQLQSPVEIVQRANIIESQPPMVPTLVQQMTLDPSQSYQLVTDQGVFNIESIVPVQNNSKQTLPNSQVVQQISIDAGQSFIPQSVQHIVSNVPEPIMQDNNPSCVYRPVPVFDNATGLTQIMYVLDNGEINRASSVESDLGGNIPLIVSAHENEVNNAATQLSRKPNIVEVHQHDGSSQSIPSHTKNTRDQIVNHIPPSSNPLPSHIHISYETQSSDNVQQVIQQFNIPESAGVVTLPFIPLSGDIVTGDAGEQVPNNVTKASNRANTPGPSVTFKDQSDNFKPVSLTKENLNENLDSIKGEMDSKKKKNYDTTMRRVKSRNVSGSSRKSRNPSGVSNSSRTSVIMSHVSKKLHLFQESMHESQHGQKLSSSRSRQVSGNSETGDRSRKSSGNSLISETSSLPFSNLSSPNIFLDKEKGIFFIQSIDGMEMCEIEASPSIEEMIRVAESDAGNIPLGRMEYRPHSRTGLLAESDMANQQGKHDFRPLIQTGLVPRSDIVTNQVQKLEYRPLSQTGLVADNELINQKYRPQIQADTETGSVASQPEYVAQNQTGLYQDSETTCQHERQGYMSHIKTGIQSGSGIHVETSQSSRQEYRSHTCTMNVLGSERDTVTGQSEIIHDYKPQENISTKADSKVESSEHRPKKGTGLASKSFIVKDKHENKSQTMAGMGSQKNARATGKTKKRNNKVT